MSLQQFVIVGSLALITSGAFAGDLFELDGNAFQDGMPPPEDWSLLNMGMGTAEVFSGVLPDPGQDTIFTGGRKDIQDITQWGWKNDGGFPDKNDITNAYAAAYYDSNGDLIVYFGADRYANNGDAFLGFWFFGDDVSLNMETMRFNGQHMVGDLLVLVNYPQGTNAVPEIKVLEWNPDEADIATNLKLLFNGEAAICGNVPPSTACAITNLEEELSPWDYTPKQGMQGVFPPESFFEGGINLSEVLGSTPCFTSFMAETRSSTSITATLKDFVLGTFPLCFPSLEITWDCNVELSSINGLLAVVVQFNGVVTNTGNVELVVNVESDLTGVVLANTLVGPGESIPITATYTPDSGPTNPNEVVFGNVVTATGTNPQLDPVSASAATTCSLCE